MMKRIVKWLCVLVFISMLLIACGQKIPTSIKIACIVKEGTDLSTLENTQIVYEPEQYQVEFEYVIVDREKPLAEQMAAYDLVYGNAYEFSKQDWETTFIDLRSELEEGALKPYYESMPELYWESLQVDGKVYGLTRMTPPPIHSLWISQDELETLGITVPEGLYGKPLEEWGTFFAEVFEKNGHKPFLMSPHMLAGALSPVMQGNVWEAHFQMVAPHIGIAYDQPELGLQCVYESAYAEKMNGVWENFYDAGYVITSPLDMSGLVMRSVAGYSLAPMDVSEEYRAYPLQSIAYASPMVELIGETRPYAAMLQIPQTVDEKKVYEFLNKMVEDEAMAEAICKMEKGYRVLTPFLQSLNPLGGGEIVTGLGKEREAYLDYYETMQSVVSPGFVLDKTNVQTEWEAIEQMIYEKSANGLIQHNPVEEQVGSNKDWASYRAAMDRFVENLYDKGLENILKEGNEQLVRMQK